MLFRSDLSSLCTPLFLEIGLRIEEGVVGPAEKLEATEGRDLFGGPLGVILVIGFEEELAAGYEDLLDRGQELLLHETPAVVARFGPGIRKEEMQAAHRGGREEPLDGVAGFEAEDAQVAQVRPGREIGRASCRERV